MSINIIKACKVRLVALTLIVLSSSSAYAMDACKSILCLNAAGATQPQCRQARADFFTVTGVTTPLTIAARTAYLMTCQPTNGTGGNTMALIPLIITKYGALNSDPQT